MSHAISLNPSAEAIRNDWRLAAKLIDHTLLKPEGTREQVAKLCREAGFVEPEQLAEELFLLFEGACINVQSMGRCGPGSRFTEMACALLKSRARHTDRN